MISPLSNKRSVTISIPGIDGMSTPALLNRWAVSLPWLGALRFLGFCGLGSGCLPARVTNWSRAAGIASVLPCLGAVVGDLAGFLTTDVSLRLDVSIIDAVTGVGMCVAKVPIPFDLFDIEATVAACFSAAMAAHLSTLFITTNASGSSASREAMDNALRLCLLGVIAAFRVFRFRVTVRLLLSWSNHLRESGLPLVSIHRGKCCLTAKERE